MYKFIVTNHNAALFHAVWAVAKVAPKATSEKVRFEDAQKNLKFSCYMNGLTVETLINFRL